jgi:hypothetical protein
MINQQWFKVLILVNIKRRGIPKIFMGGVQKGKDAPTFDGEVKSSEEAKAWLLGLRKYFQVHDYSRNMKARVAIFNMNGRASIWWEYLKNVKRISERKIT